MNNSARILINLGAPEKPTPECAEKFLFEFLSDKNVLSLPQPMRTILAFYISKKRKYAYAESLKKVFEDNVHLLKKHTQNLANKISEIDGKEVYVAYRYGKDNISSVVTKLKERGINNFLFAPMYPQQTLSTTETACQVIRKILKKDEYKIAKSYYNNKYFISALASTVVANTQTLVVSFHSVPLSHTKASPYVAQCQETAKLLAQQLKINDFHIAWQSAMPKGEWVKPSAIELVERLAKEGKKVISVVAPSFACDCSETIVELGQDLRTRYFKLGGKEFNLSASLNSSDLHAQLFSQIFNNLENSK